MTLLRIPNTKAMMVVMVGCIGKFRKGQALLYWHMLNSVTDRWPEGS